MAREGALPKTLGTLAKRTRTPVIASLIILAVTLSFLPLGKVGVIAKITSFGSLLTFALVNIALLHLRRVAPSLPRAFKVPVSIRWVSITGLLGVVSCIALLTQFDWLSVSLGLILPFSGLVVHLLMRRRNVLIVDPTIHQAHEGR